MNLQWEPVENKNEDEWQRRAETLRRHGAIKAEVEYLRHRRVELNAMPSDMFVGFLERKLTEHAIKKVIPQNDIIEAHARNVLEQILLQRHVEDARERISAEAAAAALPVNIRELIETSLRVHPEFSWDMAVAHVVGAAP
jgi:hypothetical protein